MAVRKPHLREKEEKDQRKGRDKEEGKERKEETEAQTPQRKATTFEQADDDTEASKKTELAELDDGWPKSETCNCPALSKRCIEREKERVDVKE